MSYKYSKGAQVIGDLKAADDTQRDTKIDFGEDQIDFHTSGSMKMQIANDGITTTLPIHISGSAIEGLRLAKGGSDYRAIVFEVDGADNANISVSNAENFVIQNEMNGKDIQFWVNPNVGSSIQAMTIKESGLIGIATTDPNHALDVTGDIGINGSITTTSNNDMSLDPNGSGVVIFKGNATKGAGQFKLNCENNSHGITLKGPPHSAGASYTLTLPNDDGTNGQVLQTDGSGVLSWANQSGGGLTKTLNALANAAGDVDHDCSNSSFFHHTNIAGNFTPNFTNLNMQNNQVVEGGLILTQGGTGYLPNNFEVDSTGSAIYWEGTAMPTASTNGTDTIDLKITRVSDNYNVFARFSTTIYVAAQGGGSGVSIPSNALLFLDASDTNSYNGSGTTWTDLSSNSKNGTLVNSPTWSGSDKWFEFAGGNTNQHITLPTGFADFTGGATFFFVADLGVGNNWERLIDFSVGGDHINVGRNQTGTNMTLEYYNPSKQGTTSNIIQNNTLANYVVTTDGTHAKFYRNGTLLTTNNFQYLPSNSARSQNYIGRSRGGAAYYEGKMAVVAIFSRALSATEITDLYNHYNSIYSF